MLYSNKINDLIYVLDKLGLKSEISNLQKVADVSLSGGKDDEKNLGKIINIRSNQAVIARARPDVDSPAIMTLKKDDQFEYLNQKENNLIKIKFQDLEGWIPESYAEYSDSKNLIGSEEIESPEEQTASSGRKFHNPIKGLGLKITSKFGWRIHPILKKKMFHSGTDFIAGMNTPLVAIESGIVESTKDRGNAGNTLVLKGSKGREWSYMHLSSFSKKPGDKVMAGEEIGRSGRTGRATGPHLHLQLKINGSATDPVPVLNSLGISAG